MYLFISKFNAFPSISSPKQYQVNREPINQGETNFPNNQDTLQISRRQKGYKKQVQSWGPTNIVSRNRTKSRRHVDSAPEICYIRGYMVR